MKRRPVAPWSDGSVPWRQESHGTVLRASAPIHYGGSAEGVARGLLGSVLETDIDGKTCVGVIVEVEAYGGPDDPASHAATKKPTARNRIMYGPPGVAYVYRSYGVHWCFNVVCRPEGEAGAVLIRGVDPVKGADTMLARRGEKRPLAAGPGRVCQAFGITGEHNGRAIGPSPHGGGEAIRVCGGWQVPDAHLVQTGRVGVTEAAEARLRFYVRGAQGVTPHALNEPER